MKSTLFAMLLLACALPALAEERVTISKARLEELERKEAELERLKGTAVGGESQQSYPSMGSLPSVQAGEAVDAGMLAAHFRQDPAAALKRYGHGRLAVIGVISGFDRQLAARNFKVILRTPGSDLPIICDFAPDGKYRSISTANGGATLVATLKDDSRVTLARVGQSVTIEGECRGVSRKAVRLVGSRFHQPSK
jgi:hypothetical protein